MTVDTISAARLGVFIVFLPFASFCLFKHGKPGFLGWLFVILFCVLRVVTGGMGLHGNHTSTAFIILNSIGLSPLLLAAADVSHEARRATNAQLNMKREVFWEVQFHILVATGMTLVIVAVANLLGGGSASANQTLLKAGSALVCLAWLFLSLWALLSTYNMRRSSVPSNLRGGKTLLMSVLVVLPLIALRLGYGLAYLHLMTSYPVPDFVFSVAGSVCLSVVPEMLCIGILLLAGLLTRDLKRELKKRDQGFAPDQEL